MLFVEPEVDCFRLHLRDLRIPAAVLAQQPNTVATAPAPEKAVTSPRSSARTTAEPLLRPTAFSGSSGDGTDTEQQQQQQKQQRGSSPDLLSPASAPSAAPSSNRASATVSASTRASSTSVGGSINRLPAASPHLSLDERADVLHRALLSALQSRFPYELPDTLECAYVLVVTHCAAPSTFDQPLTSQELACLTPHCDYLPAELRCRTFPSHLNAILDPVWTAAAANTEAATEAALPTATESATAPVSVDPPVQRPSIRVTAGGVDAEPPAEATAAAKPETAAAAAATAQETVRQTPLLTPRFYDTFFLLARDLTPAQQACYHDTQYRGDVPPAPSRRHVPSGPAHTQGGVPAEGAMASFSVVDGHLTHFVPASTTTRTAVAQSGSGSIGGASAAALANAAWRIRRDSRATERRVDGESATYVIQSGTPSGAARIAGGSGDDASNVRSLHFSVYRIPLTRFAVEDQDYHTKQREKLRWRQSRRQASSDDDACELSSSEEAEKDEGLDGVSSARSGRQHFGGAVSDLFCSEPGASGADGLGSAPQQRAATHFFHTCQKILTSYALAHATREEEEWEEEKMPTTNAAHLRRLQQRQRLAFPRVSFVGVTRLLYSLAPCDCYHLVMKDNNPLYYASSSRASYVPQTVALSLVSDLTERETPRASVGARGTATLAGQHHQQQQRETVLRRTTTTTLGGISRGTGTSAAAARGEVGRPSPGPSIAGKVLLLPQPTVEASNVDWGGSSPPSLPSRGSTGSPQRQRQLQQQGATRRSEEGLVRSRQPSPDRGDGSRRPSATLQRAAANITAAAGASVSTEGVLRVTAALVSNSISGNPRHSEASLLQKGAQVPAFLLPDAARRGPRFSDTEAAAASSSTAATAVNLWRALAESSLAQHELRSGSIRSVLSVAILDSSDYLSYTGVGGGGCARRCGGSDVAQLRQSARFCCRGLVDHTWMSLPVQHTPAEQEAIEWMPVLLGSTECVSDVGLRTAVHLGIFPPATPDAAVRSSAGGGSAAVMAGWPTRDGAIASLTPSLSSRPQDSRGSTSGGRSSAESKPTSVPLQQRAASVADATATPMPAPQRVPTTAKENAFVVTPPSSPTPSPAQTRKAPTSKDTNEGLLSAPSGDHRAEVLDVKGSVSYPAAATTDGAPLLPRVLPPATQPSSPRLPHEQRTSSWSSSADLRVSFPTCTTSTTTSKNRNATPYGEAMEDVPVDPENEEEAPDATKPPIHTARGGIAMKIPLDAALIGAPRVPYAVPDTEMSTCGSGAATATSGGARARRVALQGRKAIGWADTSPLRLSFSTPLPSMSSRRGPAPHRTVTTTNTAASTCTSSWTALPYHRHVRSSCNDDDEDKRQEGLRSTIEAVKRGQTGAEDDSAEAEEFVSSSLDRNEAENEEAPAVAERATHQDERRFDTPMRRPAAPSAMPNPFQAYMQSASTPAAVPPHTPRSSSRLPACFSAFAAATSVNRRGGDDEEQKQKDVFFDLPPSTTPAAATAPSPRTPAPRFAVQLTPSSPSGAICQTPRRAETVLRWPHRFSSPPLARPAAAAAVHGAASPSQLHGSLSALSCSSEDCSPSGTAGGGCGGTVRTREHAPPPSPLCYFDQGWNERRTQHTSAEPAAAAARSATAQQYMSSAPSQQQQQQSQQRMSFFGTPFGLPASVLGECGGGGTVTALPRTPHQRPALGAGRFSAYSPPVRVGLPSSGDRTTTHNLSHTLCIDEYDDAAVLHGANAGAHEGGVPSRVRPRGACASDPAWFQPVRELTSAPNLRFSSAWRPTTALATAASNAAAIRSPPLQESMAELRLSTSVDQPYNVSSFTRLSHEGTPLPPLRGEAYRIPVQESVLPATTTTRLLSRGTEGSYPTTASRSGTAACRLSLGGVADGRTAEQPYAPAMLPPPSPLHGPAWRKQTKSTHHRPAVVSRVGSTVAPSVLGRLPPLAPARRSEHPNSSGCAPPHRYAAAAAYPHASTNRWSTAAYFRPYSAAASSADGERRRHAQERQRKLDYYQQHLQENYICGPEPKRFCFEKPPPLHPLDSAAVKTTQTEDTAAAARPLPAWVQRTTALPSCMCASAAAPVAKKTTTGDVDDNDNGEATSVNNPLSDAARAFSFGVHPPSNARGVVPPLPHTNISGGGVGGAAAAETRLREQADQEDCMDARQEMEKLIDGESARCLSSGVNVSFTLRDIASVLLRLPGASCPTDGTCVGGLEVLDISTAAWRTTGGVSCFLSRAPTRLQGGWERYLERINLYQEPFYLREQAIVLLLPVPHVPELKVCVAIHNINDVLALVCQTPVPRVRPSAEEAWLRQQQGGRGEEEAAMTMPAATGAPRTSPVETIEERRWFFGLFTTRRIIREKKSAQQQQQASLPGSECTTENAARRARCRALGRQHHVDCLCLTWRHRLRFWTALFQAGQTCQALSSRTSPLLTDPALCRARCALLCGRVAAYATLRHRLATLRALRHAYEEDKAEMLSRQRVRKLCDAPLPVPRIRLGDGGASGDPRGERDRATTASPLGEGHPTRVAAGGVAFPVGSAASSTWTALHGSTAPPATPASMPGTTATAHIYCVRGQEMVHGASTATTSPSHTAFACSYQPPRGTFPAAAVAGGVGERVSPQLFNAAISSVAPYSSGASLTPARRPTAACMSEQMRQQQTGGGAPVPMTNTTTTADSTSTARLALRAAAAAASTGLGLIHHVDRDDALSAALHRLADVRPAAVPPPLTVVLSVVPRAAQPVRGAGAGVVEEAPTGLPTKGSDVKFDTATPLFAGCVPTPVEVQQRLAQPFSISIGQVQQLVQWQWEHHQHSYTLLPLPLFGGSVTPSVDFALLSRGAGGSGVTYAQAASSFAVSPLAREILLHLARWTWLLPPNPNSTAHGRRRPLRSSFLCDGCCFPRWRVLLLLVALAFAVEQPGVCLSLALGTGAVFFTYKGCTVGLTRPLPSHGSSSDQINTDVSSVSEWRPRLLLLCGPRIRLPRLWKRVHPHNPPRTAPRCISSANPLLALTPAPPPLQQRVSLLYSLSDATTVDMWELQQEQSTLQLAVAQVLRWQSGAAAVVSRVHLALCGYSTAVSLCVAQICLAHLLLYGMYRAVIHLLHRCVGLLLHLYADSEGGVWTLFAASTVRLLRRWWGATTATLSAGGAASSSPSSREAPVELRWHMSEAVWRDIFESVRFLLLQRMQAASGPDADATETAAEREITQERGHGGAFDGVQHGKSSYFYQNGRYYTYDAEPPAWTQKGGAPTVPVSSSSPSPSSGTQFFVPPTTPGESPVAPASSSTSARMVQTMSDWVAQLVRGGVNVSAPVMPDSVMKGASGREGEQQVQGSSSAAPPRQDVARTSAPPSNSHSVNASLLATTTSSITTSTAPYERSAWVTGNAEPSLFWFVVVVYVVTACLPRSPFRWLWGRVWGLLTHDDALARRPLLTV